MPSCPTDHPLVYEVNTRVWLRGLGTTLAEVPDAELDKLASWGVDFVWLMGVWRTGARGRQIARAEPSLRPGYDTALPGWTEADVVSSPYAVAGYQVADELGGPGGLAALRDRLRARGIGVVLDFVPNHLALDHPWVAEHPDWFVGSADRRDGTFQAGERWIAHGRDPYFPPWSDTAQLDHRNPRLRAALVGELLAIAEQCDGVRCDMAMLVLADIFERTWAGWPAPEPRTSGEFWAAAIPAVRRTHPTFLMLGEAYWDTESRLQQLDFDHLYDKGLYDRVARLDAGAVRAHLRASLQYQRRLARFVENHDEERGAAVWPGDQLRAALVASLTLPGLRLVHEGQVEGRRRRLPVQLARRADEPPDPTAAHLHARLFAALATDPFRRGTWCPLDLPDALDTLAWTWDAARFGQALCLIHMAPHAARLRIPLPLPGLADRSVRLLDHLTGANVEVEDASQGLELDLAPWDARIYAIE